jgi:nitrite reductase/ring-hydroxylating ferredoxin subunit
LKVCPALDLNQEKERQAMQTDAQQTNIADSSSQAEYLKDNEFRVEAVLPGSATLVGDAAEAKCTHRRGPLNEGRLDGSTVTCPWHGSQYNVCTGAVLRGPATEPVKTYRVVVEGEIGRVEKD